MRGAACVGMLATVSGKMKVVQKIASADGLTLVAERVVVTDIWIERLLLTSGSRDFGNIDCVSLRGGFLPARGPPRFFMIAIAFASPPASPT